MRSHVINAGLTSLFFFFLKMLSSELRFKHQTVGILSRIMENRGIDKVINKFIGHGQTHQRFLSMGIVDEWNSNTE